MTMTFGPGITFSGTGINAGLPLNSPASVTAVTRTVTSANVVFCAPPLNGNPPIKYYVATSSPGNITATLTQSGSGTITVNGLTTGSTYTFSVTAYNAFGPSVSSTVTAGITMNTVPDAPIIGTAARISTGTSATVIFTAPANNGGLTITKYIATSSGSAVTATLSQAGSGTITVTGLTIGNTYTFTVVAVNSLGASQSSSASNCVAFPAAPSSYSYVTAGTYSWVAPAGVNSVSVVAIGGGGGAAASGVSGNGGDSYFCSTSLVKGGGGKGYSNSSCLTTCGCKKYNPGGSYTVSAGCSGGGNGGRGYYRNCGGGAQGGGGGAGGYSGAGGYGAQAGSGGGGGGGVYGGNGGAGGGGGVGIHGQSCNGAGGAYSSTTCGSVSYMYGGGGGGGSSGGAGGHTYLYTYSSGYYYVAEPGTGGTGYSTGGVTAPTGTSPCSGPGVTNSGGGNGGYAYFGKSCCTFRQFGGYFIGGGGGGAFGGGGGAGGQGGGGSVSSGGGGGLAWKNNISTTPGNSYTVVVGVGGAGSQPYCYAGYKVGAGGSGGAGAVRIVWPGNTRKFPSTCVSSP